MRRHLAILAAAACISGAGLAHADKVEFKNGDVLTGDIVSYDGKVLTLKTKAAKEVKIDINEVKTFSSTGPITVKLKDGTLIGQHAEASEENAISLNNHVYPFSQIKQINPPEVKWTGSVTAGAVVTRGNTFTDQYHAAFDLQRRGEFDRITSSGAYNFGRDENIDTGEKSTSTDNIMLQGKYDHFLDGTKCYLFANASGYKDRIQNLNVRFVPGVGVGYQWIESPTLNFNTEAGLSWIYEDYENEPIKESLATRLAYQIDKTVYDRVKLFHKLEYIQGLESDAGYLINTDVGVRSDITASFFLEAKVELTHNSEPAAGNTKDDLRYIFGVGWKF